MVHCHQHQTYVKKNMVHCHQHQHELDESRKQKAARVHDDSGGLLVLCVTGNCLTFCPIGSLMSTAALLLLLHMHGRVAEYWQHNLRGTGGLSAEAGQLPCSTTCHLCSNSMHQLFHGMSCCAPYHRKVVCGTVGIQGCHTLPVVAHLFILSSRTSMT
jgi:hypothetical protein